MWVMMQMPSDKELAAMPLPQLQQLLASKEEELASRLGELEMLQNQEMPEKPMEAAPAAPPAPQTLMPMDEFGMGMTPEKVQSATAMLVEAGMLDNVSGDVTPELVAQLQMIADQIDPGLYDLSQPEQLEEFINGINDGTIKLTPREPVPAAGGQPALPAGQPAGLPAAGLAPPAGAPVPIL
jgi:hypothetical protein